MTACDVPLPPYDPVCDVCIVGFQFLEDVIAFQPTEEVIEWVLDYICYIFPAGQYRDQCEVWLNEEFEKIIELLLNKYPAEEICKLVGGCKA